MALQLQSQRRVQRRNVSLGKFRWLITMTALFIAVSVITQLLHMLNVMKGGGLADGRSEVGSVLPIDRSHGVPMTWEKSETKVVASASLATKSATGPINLQSTDVSLSNSSVATRKWAYVFLLGGCNSREPEYRGFLYTIMMSARRLRDMGSQADVVLMIQMSTKTVDRKLPAQEEKLLEALNIKFRYIPRFVSPVHENFYVLMMEKFRILEYVGVYSRVLFLDSDQWPLCNLDYLFELSEPPAGQTPTLKENLLLAWKLEPCNGGFFMFAPKPGDYEQISSIIRRREEEALEMDFPYWNETAGWGHVFDETDKWVPAVKGYNNSHLGWTWHGAFTDQGLIYYWAKYVKQSVSIIINAEIEHWGSCDGKVCLEKRVAADLDGFSCANGGKQLGTSRNSPYRDIFHMTGGSNKPWAPSGSAKNTVIKKDWFRELNRMERDFLGNNEISSSVATLLQRRRQPTVGSFPVYNQMILHIKAKAGRNWNPYETEEDLENLF